MVQGLVGGSLEWGATGGMESLAMWQGREDKVEADLGKVMTLPGQGYEAAIAPGHRL